MSNSLPPYENPFQSPLADTAEIAPTEAEAIRREYIKHEASVKSIGLLYLLGGILIIPIAIFAVLAVVFGGQSTSADVTAIFVVGAAVYLGFGILQLLTGIGLRKLKPWTRIVGSIFSAIGLIGFPLGTLISVYFLYLLLSKKGAYVFSPEYKDIIEATPHIKHTTSKVLLALLAVLILVLAAGAVAFVASQFSVNGVITEGDF